MAFPSDSGMSLGRPSFSRPQFQFLIFMAGKPLGTCALRRYDNASPFDSGDTCLEVLHAANFVTQHPADLHRTDYHDEGLDICRDLAAQKETTLPALKEIHLICLNGVDEADKDHCTSLLAETEKEGVILHLEPRPHSGALTWEGEL
ncbi:hypothetical protein JMJ35_002438 [Cladonia borealis]|uniref:Uncharacterized protein n=1 Tax=Cladonia borealis TaxID=184061 RepID=A0AA39R7D9_9LECA|nr:hypothetical protein JMJ35_002438 [Cladonia borealis]